MPRRQRYRLAKRFDRLDGPARLQEDAAQRRQGWIECRLGGENAVERCLGLIVVPLLDEHFRIVEAQSDNIGRQGKGTLHDIERALAIALLEFGDGEQAHGLAIARHVLRDT